MKLIDFLLITSRDSIIHLLVDNKTVLLGEIYHYFQDWDSYENDNLNSYVAPYADFYIDTLEWTNEYLYVFIYTGEYIESGGNDDDQTNN